MEIINNLFQNEPLIVQEVEEGQIFVFDPPHRDFENEDDILMKTDEGFVNLRNGCACHGYYKQSVKLVKAKLTVENYKG